MSGDNWLVEDPNVKLLSNTFHRSDLTSIVCSVSKKDCSRNFLMAVLLVENTFLKPSKLVTRLERRISSENIMISSRESNMWPPDSSNSFKVKMFLTFLSFEPPFFFFLFSKIGSWGYSITGRLIVHRSLLMIMLSDSLPLISIDFFSLNSCS